MADDYCHAERHAVELQANPSEEAEPWDLNEERRYLNADRKNSSNLSAKGSNPRKENPTRFLGEMAPAIGEASGFCSFLA
jgi:hypothetical protein